MKKGIMVMMAIVVACSLTACGTKDYSFVQEEWDTNDLSFVESTPDPNEAYRAISYFAERYNDYSAVYHEAEEAGEYDFIRMGTPSIERLLMFDYYILEDEETAKKYYEKNTAEVSDEDKTDLRYGDAAVRIETNEGEIYRYWILDGSCVMKIWIVFREAAYMSEIENFLDYMY